MKQLFLASFNKRQQRMYQWIIALCPCLHWNEAPCWSTKDNIGQDGKIT